jgi:hypothetical protein
LVEEHLLVGQSECLQMDLWEQMPLDQTESTAMALGLGDSQA